MHQDCDRCGVFGPCDKEGICYDCRVEEQYEQDGEEEAEEAQKEED
jgi:hypothetical protein